MENIVINYKYYVFHKKYLASLLSAILLFCVSLVINFYAGIYATQSASNPVGDVVLDNIRVYDVDLIFVYGPPVFWAFVAFFCFIEPKRLPFAFKSIALFVIVRSVFITLTHIGPFPGATPIDLSSVFLSRFTFGGDLFFSAHTGLPYLMALVFWENKILRVLFVITAIVFGVVVLMGHLHYSIDVLSAFFITYSIFHMACAIFKKDKLMFDDGVEIKKI